MTGEEGASAVEIAPGVHWVGVLDPGLRSFDLILKTANGTTYNAYVVRGPNGVAVIDTVKEEYQDEFFEKLESLCTYDEITTIVLNHLEPDHTGALPELMRRAPWAEVLISGRAERMIKALLKADVQDFPHRCVETGDSVNIGGRKLSFFSTPYLHWPDTQCTWLEDCGLLFSGDIFGCHYCDGRLFNDAVGDYHFSFEYYYAHIMRPFKTHVLEALDLIEPLKARLIAPAHGPILRSNPLDYVARYRELSEGHESKNTEGPKSLLIFYMSAYGSTAKMAQRVYEGAESIDGVRPSKYDLEGGDPASFVDLIERADGLCFGSPTINADAVKPIWDLLTSLNVVDTRSKLGAAFGSYGWTGEAVEMIEQRLRGLKMRVPEAGVRVKLRPTEEELDACFDFGQRLAKQLTGQMEARVIDFASL